MKQRFSTRTRLVSALLTLAMVFTFLPFSAFAATDIYGPVYISDLTFPDETFLNYVKWFDTDKNGTLSPEERYKVTEIYVSGKKITSLKGIEFFPNLKKLYCADNNLTSLDVNQNTALEHLDCDNNQLTSLQLDDCTNLGTYNCDGNEYSVQVYESTRILDPGTLPGKFDISRVRNMKGATKNADGTMTVNPGVGKVTYKYRFLRDNYATFTLNVTVIPDGIRIYGDNFPNYEFRQYLKANIDKDGDGYLNDTELNIRTLDVSGQHIANLKGIEFFPNLEKLYCYNNKLTSLDVSQNPALQYLYCMNNKLTSLDVSQNEKLENLFCDKNQLTSLDVTQNIALKELHCTDNLLTSLDVSKNPKLDDLECEQNQLTELDVSKNAKLWRLDCDQNKLSSLDVSKNSALGYLYCSKNQLTSLDVSKNTKLKRLNCENNQLTNLNVENTSIDPTDSLLSGFEAQNNTYSIAVETTPRTFDLSTLPGFDVTKASGWVGGTVDGSTLKVDEGATQVTYTYDCGKGCSATFTLNVKVVPDGTVTPPSGGDTGTTTPPSGGEGTGTTTPPSGGGTGTTTPPSGGGTGTTTPPSGGGTGTTTPPSGGDGGGGAVIIMAAGAAVAGVVGYGVYNYVSGQKLQALLPEGVAAPENRAQTALLLWNTAGRPEPAEAPAFADVADPDTAKAAQWCVEQGLMKRRLNGKFAPDSSIPAYQVLNAYRKLAGG